MLNLWTSHVRKTRSGTIFAAWMNEANALRAEDFQFGPLVSRAVAAESNDQEDREPDDDINDINVEWPPNPDTSIDDQWPPPDPLNDVDDPPPPPPAPKRRRSPSFDDLLATGKPQTGNHRRRAAKRAKGIESKGYEARASTICDHILPAKPVPAPAFDAADLPAAQGAYGAKVESKQEKYGHKKRRTLAELIGLGFQVIHWNGIDARPLMDSTGRIFAVLAGQPTKDRYHEAVNRAYDFIKTQGTASCFPAAMRRHRRGLFAAINVGLTYGKGQTDPTWLDNKQYTSLAERLLANTDIIRMANFASAAFRLWAPLLYAYYVDYNTRLAEALSDLKRPFPKSVFSSAAFNFGPNVWTFKHRDVCNLPYGWCAVQALGRFDPTEGGHLIFWDLKMVVEFPSGALILLPSATIAHSNIPVRDGEERVSFTQFTAGGLFRYIDNGCRTQDRLASEDPEKFASLMKLRESRWQDGLALFSTLDELLPDE
ncbi:hypothetical protein DFH07DRAFT_764761 [Mycena maculata]|uniref:Uncharacterized protein n=1 Tax=Mycena maculata TaxID=230809 RepID=A0AAD7NZF7_9AGAR|nr:hypothetical protein DFH07DRAFT_764761 [Mycena maculata]